MNNTDFGTDHYVHLRIIRFLKKNKKYFLKDVFTLNEKYCFYPFFFHWLISLTPIDINKNFIRIYYTILVVRLINFSFFLFYFTEFSFQEILLCVLTYLSFPFNYLKWNSINKGFSARGFGILLAEIFLYFTYSFIVFNQNIYLLINLFIALIILLSSQLTYQFLLLSSIFFFIYYLNIIFLILPIISALILYVLNREVFVNFFYGQYYHKRNYCLYFIKSHFKIRESYYRDFFYDFFVEFKKDFKHGLKYFFTNPFIEIIYGFPLLIMIFFRLNNETIYDNKILLLFISVGVLSFLATSLKKTRFLGEPQRYIQFVIPFIIIFAVKEYEDYEIIYFLVLSILIILIYHRIYSNENINPHYDFQKNLDTIKKSLPNSSLIISNDIQKLKILSSEFNVICNDWSRKFKNEQEFNSFHKNNYTIHSVLGLLYFYKKFKPNILLLNEELYDNKEIFLIKNNIRLKLILQIKKLSIFRIIN